MKILALSALLVLVSGAAAFAQPATRTYRCEFSAPGGKAGDIECKAKISHCMAVPALGDQEAPTNGGCRDHMFVECNGQEIYDGGFLWTGNTGIIFQGITSLRNPTPPMIDIIFPFEGTPPRADAELFTSFGKLEGSCTTRSVQ